MTSSDLPVIVAGGGPSGLAAALMLKRHGFRNVIVIEKRSEESFQEAVAYTYLINGRGQRLTDLLDLTGTIAQVGIGLSEVKELHEFTADGKLNVKKTFRPPSACENYFIPRDRLLDIFRRKVEGFNANCNAGDQIKILFNTSIQAIDCMQDGVLSVKLQCIADKGADPQVMLTNFLIGCDGVHSMTRKYLEQHRGVKTTQLTSPAVGLRFKMLKLKADPNLPNYSADKFYTIVNNGNSSFNRFRLTFFPVRDLKDPRRPLIRTCANVCSPMHELWNQKSLLEIKELFHRRFPQLNVSEFFADEELERFANDRGGVFPPIQYVDKVYGVFSGSDSTSCIVILGDAAHCFPPDMGAGVNAALEDVFRLHVALDQSPNDIPEALLNFERSAVPENKALCELLQFAFPYQYRQSIVMFYVNLMNMGFRSVLARIAPMLFSPSAFGMALNHTTPYSEVLRRAHATTRNIYLLVGGLCSAATILLLRDKLQKIIRISI